MSKKTKTTKMSLQELAAMRGIEKPEAGCTFDAELAPRDYEAEEKAKEAAKKAAEEAQTQARIAEKAAKKAAEAEQARVNLFNAAKEVNFPLCFTSIEGAEGWFIFACRDEVPFFFCPKAEEGDYLVPDLGGITFNAYKYADEFFTSEEVSWMQLDEAVELWRKTGHYSTHPAMHCYGDGCHPNSEPASDWHWNDRDA